METTNSMSTSPSPSKATLLTCRIIKILCILFLLFDAVMKIIKERHSIQGSVALGWPEHAIQPIGIILLICTILYAIPRTAMIGAILLTGYLGGAIAIMVRAEQPLYFASVFGILVWVGLMLERPAMRSFLWRNG